MTTYFDKCFVGQYDIVLEKGNGGEYKKGNDLGDGISNN
jgi:hypothetical protein